MAYKTVVMMLMMHGGSIVDSTFGNNDDKHHLYTDRETSRHLQSENELIETERICIIISSCISSFKISKNLDSYKFIIKQPKANVISEVNCSCQSTGECYHILADKINLGMNAEKTNVTNLTKW